MSILLDAAIDELSREKDVDRARAIAWLERVRDDDGLLRPGVESLREVARDAARANLIVSTQAAARNDVGQAATSAGRAEAWAAVDGILRDLLVGDVA